MGNCEPLFDSGLCSFTGKYVRDAGIAPTHRSIFKRNGFDIGLLDISPISYVSDKPFFNYIKTVEMNELEGLYSRLFFLYSLKGQENTTINISINQTETLVQDKKLCMNSLEEVMNEIISH